MKRTLSVTLVVGGVLFVICALLLGRQQSILVAEEAQAVAERARALAEAPPPLSLPGEQGGAGVPNDSGGASLLPVDPTLNRFEPDSDLVPSRRLPLPMAPAHPRDDQDAAMDRQAKQLAANVRDADEPAKSKFRAELEKLTEKHFEYRQRRRSAEIADMAERVDKLRVAHHRRQENKPDILKRRLADLLDEDNELKWDDARNQPAQNRIPGTGTVAAPIANPPDMNSAAAPYSLPLTEQLIEALGGPNSDLVRLHGVWEIDSVEPGEKLPPGLTLLIDALKAEGLIVPDRPGLDGRHVGDVMFRLGIQSNKMRITLSGSKLPKNIDITAQGDGEPIKTIYGIYTIDSFNKLTIILVPPGEARPQNFKAPLQPKHVRLQLSRRPKPADAAAVPSLDIDGEWLVTLPAGFEFVGKIEKQPEGCWSFTEMRNLSGYYQLEGGKLKGVTTDPKEPREYEWLILNDNVMVLTKAPQHIGSDYRGATLRRGAKPKSSLERSQVSPNTFDLPATLEKPVASQAAIQAARRKAAEARLHLAKFELDNALQSARKVPGAVSATELEKLKTNVVVAEAELELVIAGGDPHTSKERGVPLSEPVAAAKLAKAETLLNAAKQEFDRLKKLEDRKAVSRAEVESASAAVEEAKANADLARAELEFARQAASSRGQ